MPDAFAKRLEEQFVLVSDEGPGSVPNEVLGTSCVDFVSSHWGPKGLGVLRCIGYNVGLALNNRSGGGYPESNTSPDAPSETLQVITEVVSFLSRAITVPKLDEQLVATSPAIIVKTDPDLMHIERPLILEISASEEPLRILEDSCWQSLFNVGVVANVERMTHRDPSTGKGLCVSFATMIALSSVEYPVIINKTIILVGY